MLAEVEHPLTEEGPAEWGDHPRRYAFYLRHGGRFLDVPYFQPAEDEDSPRGYGMQLILLHADPTLLHDERVASAPVAAYLRAYLQIEGAAPDDAATVALLTAADDPRGIALLPPDTDLDRLPRSAPDPRQT